MGRHTIGDQRGSVRGAPPEVYAGFASNDDDPESWKETLKLGGHFLLAALAWLLLFVIGTILMALGVLPEMSD
mgnify:CR=1